MNRPDPARAGSRFRKTGEPAVHEPPGNRRFSEPAVKVHEPEPEPFLKVKVNVQPNNEP